jgi:hypothetical protein
MFTFNKLEYYEGDGSCCLLINYNNYMKLAPMTRSQFLILCELDRGIGLIFNDGYYLKYSEGWRKLENRTIHVLISRGWIIARNDHYILTNLGYEDLKKTQK